MYKPFLIANFQTGLNLSLEPWLIPEQAFTECNNLFIKDGVLVKRPGISSYGEVAAGADIRGVIFYDKSAGGTDQLLAFSNTQMYQWGLGNIWTAKGAAWTASDNLMWGYIFNDILYLTDNTTANGIKIWNGTTLSNYVPVINASAWTIQSALMLFAYKERLVCLRTVENGVNYPQRARWSQAGSTAVATAWLEDEVGRGNYNDAPTNDEIVSAAFLKDTLIVFFKKSTWQLAYTANPDIPFIWNKINETRQISSTFGTVQYDNFITAVGGQRLLVCNGNSIDAYDEQIPNFTFSMNLSEIDQCYGKRVDKFNQAWLAYPEIGDTIPTKILSLDYEKKAWTTLEFKDGSGSDLQVKSLGSWTSNLDWTFDSLAAAYGDFDTAGTAGITWGSSELQAGYPLIMGGSTNGYIYNLSDELITTDMGDRINFGLTTKRFNPFVAEGREIKLGYVDFLVERNNNAEFTTDFFINYDNFSVVTSTIACDGINGDKVWKRAYANIVGESVQMRCYLSFNQLNGLAGLETIKIHAINLYMQPGGLLNR